MQNTIKPFKAYYYNPEKVDFAKVVCPPYDVISADDQVKLHERSPYNFTHIDLGKDKPSDSKDNNKYTRAKTIFDTWVEKNIIMQDEMPSIYFYKQEYKIVGQKHCRVGFISLMHLKNDQESKVFPHENTHAHAVDDRLQLTKALDANLSCIFVCYADQQKKVENIFNHKVAASMPMVDVKDDDGVRHILWRLSDPVLIKQVQQTLEGQQLFIADGHHRFKVANEYRQFRSGSKKSISGEEPFNYVMTYFTNIDSKDLKIFPMHRIVKKFKADLTSLEEFFRIDRIKNKAELPILLAQAGRNEHTFVLYTKEGSRLLRLKNRLLIDEVVKDGSSEYKRLDAVILKNFMFDKLGIKSEDIIYTKDMNEVMSAVDNGQAEAGFILNPVRIEQLKAIALNGEKMPPKTTYFYPKVLSGLTVYKME
ncbi:MAG: DUF1015 domain-containing protein [Candidatus Omnitrophica bacterium]|nr:DUF1015 domain-containing protein [Candidatus Omnitrophota bacterium]